MRKGRREASFSVVPAKAGTHRSRDGGADQWISAFPTDQARGLKAHGITALTGRPCLFARIVALLLAAMFAFPAWAACTGVIADQEARIWHAAAGEKAAAITFLGHASFLIESPEGVRIVPDYNGVHRAKVTPDIVTMNNAHSTHYTDAIEPDVKFVLRGWDPGGGVAHHNLHYRDVRVNNVPTNVRGFGETRYNGNSIFVFDLADLCIAHLGHLHHTLTEAHLAEI